jgi:hypothetical protein
MTKYILALCALVLAGPARADVSDSGNLTIGGTGVIQGTMTVQGSAFSVGGTTFTVAGGSVTLGGRLNASAAGIKWADGTTSTTSAAGGGSGNAVLTATQTWSGANTFTSSVTVGPSVYTTTANYNAVIKNVWSVVSTAAFTSVSSVDFTNWSSSYSYQFLCRFTISATGNLRMRLSGNTSTVYTYAGYESGAGGSSAVGAASQTSMQMLTLAGGPVSGAEISFSGMLMPYPTTEVQGFFDASTDATQPAAYAASFSHVGLYYYGAFTGMNVGMTAGNITGNCKILALVVQ